MSNYVESKKALDKIRSKNEAMFRMAISHLMDVGIRNLTEENILDTCREIQKKDDSKSFMTNDFMCDLVVMAGELAKISHVDLLVYIQREVDYDVFDGGISYKRAIELLRNCMNWFIDYDCCESKEMLKRFNELDFDDDELEALGFTWLFDTEEDEE